MFFDPRESAIAKALMQDRMAGMEALPVPKPLPTPRPMPLKVPDTGPMQPHPPLGTLPKFPVTGPMPVYDGSLTWKDNERPIRFPRGLEPTINQPRVRY